MKKILSLICAVAVFALSSFNASAVDNSTGTTKSGDFVKVGGAGSQFLKVAPGARGNGLAGAYSAMTNDLSSIYWNPAGLAQVKSMNAEFSYTQWISDFSHNFVAISTPLGENFTLAAHLINFTSGDIELTTVEKGFQGFHYQVSDVAMGLSLAGYLTEQFSFGITGKYVANSVASLESNGLAFDVGTMYETGIQGIKIGFSMFNIGTDQKYSGQDLRTYKRLLDGQFASPLDVEYLSSAYSIPLIFRAGVCGDVYKEDVHHVTAAFDFTTLSDTPEQFAIGAEYTWNDLLSVRTGYKFGHDQDGFAGGVGFKYLSGGLNAQFDYSFSPTADFGYVNRISLGVGLGK